MKAFGGFGLALTLMFMVGCAANTKQSSSLYERLGGQSGLENITDSFIHAIAKDDQIFHYFAKSDVTHFRDGFIKHLCDISNGPCRYQGDSMVDIHTGMNINEADFNRIVELLVKAMEQNSIAYTTQNQLLARLAPLRGQIIHR
jgi:hemoglobin